MDSQGVELSIERARVRLWMRWNRNMEWLIKHPYILCEYIYIHIHMAIYTYIYTHTVHHYIYIVLVRVFVVFFPPFRSFLHGYDAARLEALWALLD